MSSVIFSLADIEAGEVAAHDVNAYQPDNNGAWVLVATVAIEALPANPEDATELVWTDAAIDDTKALLLAPVSAAGIIRMSGIAPVPAMVGVDLTTIYVYTKDLTGTDDAGIKLTAQLSGNRIVIGGALISRKPHEFETDASGYLAFNVARGSVVTINFPPLGELKVATAGRAAIDLAAEVTA